MSEKAKTKTDAALKAGMDPKTARKYINAGELPSELKTPHLWRTRKDPFNEIWDEVEDYLENNDGLEAKFIFEHLQKKYPGKFPDSQLRTFQRRVKMWKATDGPPKEIYFPQIHYPGDLCASDFTDLSNMGITIQGKIFEHKVYHFILTYSNWETGTICFSESWETFSYGLQNALWKLGAVPAKHKTDCLSAAVNNLNEKKDFTDKYQGLLKHYRLQGCKTQPASPHENGDVEQSHHRFKKRLRQRLELRGSRDFSSRDEYAEFINKLFSELNLNRGEKLEEELKCMHILPARHLESCTEKKIRVTKYSTINIHSNIYSVYSQLKGEWVKVKTYPENLEVWYGDRRILTVPRLHGKNKHKINYRHIIDSLVRKPGAFHNYRYMDDLFPTIRFKIAYDYFLERNPLRADKEYLKILYLAAKNSEDRVDEILDYLIYMGDDITSDEVKKLLLEMQSASLYHPVHVEEPNLKEFDALLEERKAVAL